jgi:DNA polymerase III subunit chi
MTRIDFHVLQESSIEARWLYTCHFVEKVAALGHEILIAVDTDAEAQMLDDLLWSFKPESYIPHQILGGKNGSKVEITYSDYVQNHQDVLVNVSSRVPEQFSRFERVAEIVIQDSTILENTREHYKFYKQRGYPITQHNR